MLALAVASRRRELAIRAGVGARRQDIRALVFGEGFRLIGWGVLAGLVGAISLSRVLRSFLFEVDPNDPLTLVVVVLLFGGIASLACWAPTRRAVRVNPADALRAD